MEELILICDLCSNLWPTIVIVSFVMKQIIHERRINFMMIPTNGNLNPTTMATRLAMIHERVSTWEIRAIKRITRLIRRIWKCANEQEKVDIYYSLLTLTKSLGKEVEASGNTIEERIC